MILTELGQPSVKSAQGINIAAEQINNAIELSLSNKKSNTKFFVLVLGEFDVLSYDKRDNPSDFIYKLLVMEENLEKEDC